MTLSSMFVLKYKEQSPANDFKTKHESKKIISQRFVVYNTASSD